MAPNELDRTHGDADRAYSLSRRALLAAAGAGVVAPVAAGGTVSASGHFDGPVSRTYDVATVDPSEINTLTGDDRGDGGEGEGEGVDRTVPKKAPEATGSATGSPGPAQTSAPEGGLVERQFEGLNALDVRGVVPSDSQVAAGPGGLVQAINSQVGFFSRAGDQSFQASLDAFFAKATPLISDDDPGSGFFDTYIIFDPRVRYDPDSGRYLLACVDFSLETLDGAFLLAVSSSSDPMDPWYLYRVPPLDNTGLVDFPELGYDDEAVYLTQNFFDFDEDGEFVGFGGATMVALDKADAAAGVTAAANHFTDLRNPDGSVAFTVQPADGGGYLVNSKFQQGQTLTLWSIDDPLASDASLSNRAVAVEPYSNPPEGADQPDTEEKIDMGDDRVQRVNFDGASVWVSHTVDDGRARWYELDPAAGAVVQSGAFRENGEKTFFPAVASDGDDAVFVYNTAYPSTSGDDGYVDLGVAAVGDGEVARHETIKAGENDYDYVNPDEADAGTQTLRWGDYNGAVPDPSGDGFWVVGQYARQVDLSGDLDEEYFEDDFYGTRIAKVVP